MSTYRSNFDNYVPDSEPLARIGVGDVLPNGHTVVAVEPLPHDRNGVVVLADGEF